MKSNEPLVSVVIPHLNQLDMLEACLASLDAQSLGRAAFEVLVVDNGSTLLPEDVIARHPGTRLLIERQPGPGPARNMGVRNAAGPVLAFIDADCRAHPDWLRNALRALAAAPGRTILGGDVRIWHDGSAGVTAVEAYEGVFAYRFKLYIERYGFAGTGNLVVRRADFDEIGAFAGIQIAEDMEWGQRACGAGFQFRYVSEMIVFHPARRSLAELYVKWDRQSQHYLNMARGKPGWRIRWIVRALAILGSPAIDFAKVLGSDRIQGVSARVKAIAILIAVRVHRARTMLGLLQQGEGVIWNREAGV